MGTLKDFWIVNGFEELEQACVLAATSGHDASTGPTDLVFLVASVSALEGIQPAIRGLYSWGRPFAYDVDEPTPLGNEELLLELPKRDPNLPLPVPYGAIQRLNQSTRKNYLLRLKRLARNGKRPGKDDL